METDRDDSKAKYFKHFELPKTPSHKLKNLEKKLNKEIIIGIPGRVSSRKNHYYQGVLVSHPISHELSLAYNLKDNKKIKKISESKIQRINEIFVGESLEVPDLKAYELISLPKNKKKTVKKLMNYEGKNILAKVMLTDNICYVGKLRISEDFKPYIETLNSKKRYLKPGKIGRIFLESSLKGKSPNF